MSKINAMLKTPIQKEEMALVRKLVGRRLPTAKGIRFIIPKDLLTKKISFCVFYFNQNKLNKEDIVLNCAKTRAVNIADLYERAFELWKQRGYHFKKGKNIYFKYDDILELFEEPGATTFSTHIQISLPKEGKEQYKYGKTHQKALIDVIDKIKGDNSPQAAKLTDYINNLLDLWETGNKEKIITNFQKFLNTIK
jgi:hypothetical protein